MIVFRSDRISSFYIVGNWWVTHFEKLTNLILENWNT